MEREQTALVEQHAHRRAEQIEADIGVGCAGRPFDGDARAVGDADAEDERAILKRSSYARLREMLLGQTATAAPKGAKKGAAPIAIA